jgi:uncharacterized OsmC-like protein/predicted DsbA family dithiol-disulfide isomerase
MSYFKPEHPTLLADPVTEGDHARGPASADVTVVEYGDFACPFCRRAYRVVRQLLEKFPDVRFVFRANPRSHLFPAAEPAAEAAEAAATRGKFWEMDDRLFETEAGLGREQLLALARELGIDGPAFAAELDGHTHRAAVHAQELSGWHSHVISTPTFFVNGVRFEDAPEQLGEAVARAKRAVTAVEHVFREVRIESTGDRRRQAISVGPHRLNSDLPSEDEGNDAGPSPYDLLGSALGACTAMTIQWAADKHQIPLRHVDVRLTQSRTKDGHHVFRRSIEIDGEFADEQRARLVGAAEACPVAKTLKGEIEIETRFIASR